MQICTTSPKMPSVAEIKEAMHPNDEWGKVQELVRKYGYYNAKMRCPNGNLIFAYS